MTVSGRDIAAHHKPERNHKNSKEKKIFLFGDGTAKIFSGFDDYFIVRTRNNRIISALLPDRQWFINFAKEEKSENVTGILLVQTMITSIFVWYF